MDGKSTQKRPLHPCSCFAKHRQNVRKAHSFLPVSFSNEIRNLLSPVARLMEKYGATCGLVRHLTKDDKGGNQLYRGQGSIGLIGMARSAIRIMKDPQDENKRLLIPIKNNIAQSATPQSFEIVTRGEQKPRPAINWLGASEFKFSSLNSVPATPMGGTRKDILEILQACAPEGRTWKQIAEELSEVKPSTIRTVLSRMVEFLAGNRYVHLTLC